MRCGRRRASVHHVEQGGTDAQLFDEVVELAAGERIALLVARREDQLVLQRKFEAGELRHPHLVAPGLEHPAAQHVGGMRAELAAVSALPAF